LNVFIVSQDEDLDKRKNIAAARSLPENGKCGKMRVQKQYMMKRKKGNRKFKKI